MNKLHQRRTYCLTFEDLNHQSPDGKVLHGKKVKDEKAEEENKLAKGVQAQITQILLVVQVRSSHRENKTQN